MAYKSNKQARAEYLENEARNRERNAIAYERRKARRGRSPRAIMLLALVLILIAWYLSHRTPRLSPSNAYPAAYRP